MGYYLVGGRRYEMPASLTLGEARAIKRMTGLRPLEIEGALAVGDPDVLVALLLVVMRRVDASVTEESLDRLTAEEIEYHADEDAPDAAAEGSGASS